MTKERIKIALVTSHLKGGGKEQCVVNLANSLHADGFYPTIICLETTGALQKRIRHADIEVIELNKSPGNDLRLPYRLARLLKSRGVHIVHSNNWGTLVESVIAARLAGIPTIVHTQHGLDYEWDASRSKPAHRLRTLIKRFVSRGVTRIVAVSKEVQEMVMSEWHAPAQNVTVIHNGITLNEKAVTDEERAEMRRRFGFSQSDFIIGTVGYLRPVKDYPVLVEAMAEVVRQAPHARLVIIGSGPSKRQIEEVIQRFNLEPYVKLLGLHRDARELLSFMDLFALSSISEGISLSILEAMAAGLPVVATRVGGNPEIIEDPKTGILVPSRSPHEMAKAILSLIDDPNRKRAMGERGRDAVRNGFSVERMARDYERLYAEICSPTS